MNSSHSGSEPDVAVWYAATSGIDEVVEAACETLLDGPEQERARRMAAVARRREFRIGRALLRSTLSRYVDRPAGAWSFRSGPHGKPEIDSDSTVAPMQISLSHTSSMVACAVSREREIGLDVERRDRPQHPVEVAARWFSEEEAERIARCPEGDRRGLFLRSWTLKEAYLKACGSGLAVSPRRVIFGLDAPGGIEARFPDGLDVSDGWQFRFFEPDEIHGIAVAVRSAPGERPLTVSWNETDPLRWGR